MLSLSQPITITNEKCLICHSDPKLAPATMIDIYGSNNGFGWKLNETIGAQIVSVPMTVPLERAHQAFLVFMALMAGIFVLLFILINIVADILYGVVNPPIQHAGQ